MSERRARALAHLVFAAVTMNAPLWGYDALRRIDDAQATAARELQLRETLRSMRSMIDHYTAEREQAPPSLEALVIAGYLGAVPIDPVTGSADTWEVVLELDPIARSGKVGIMDVTSGSTALDSTGRRRYADW